MVLKPYGKAWLGGGHIRAAPVAPGELGGVEVHPVPWHADNSTGKHQLAEC